MKYEDNNPYTNDVSRILIRNDAGVEVGALVESDEYMQSFELWFEPEEGVFQLGVPPGFIRGVAKAYRRGVKDRKRRADQIERVGY